jgi:hypothetical protein
MRGNPQLYTPSRSQIDTDHFDGISELSDADITAGEPSRTHKLDETCIVLNFHGIMILGSLLKQAI